MSPAPRCRGFDLEAAVLTGSVVRQAMLFQANLEYASLVAVNVSDAG